MTGSGSLRPMGRRIGDQLRAAKTVACAGVLLGSFGFFIGVGPAYAQDAKPAAAAPADPAKTSQYCVNIANAAADARAAWQKETLAALEKDLEKRIKELEVKRAEVEEWLRRRNEVLAKADENLVAIYSRMRADAAALQLANMSDESAAAILSKLNPRSASAVLGEMEPARAAQLTSSLTGATKRAEAPRKPL